MKKKPAQHAPARQPQVIVPAYTERMDGKAPDRFGGYVVHTGEARSMEDVTIRDGHAPLLARGVGAEEVEEDWQDAVLDSGGAPD